jgi:hypothetical protein
MSSYLRTPYLPGPNCAAGAASADEQKAASKVGVAERFRGPRPEPRQGRGHGQRMPLCGIQPGLSGARGSSGYACSMTTGLAPPNVFVANLHGQGLSGVRLGEGGDARRLNTHLSPQDQRQSAAPQVQQQCLGGRRAACLDPQTAPTPLEPVHWPRLTCTYLTAH